MTCVKVWAPQALFVDLWTDGRLTPMAKGEYGWWHCEADHIYPGVDYAFCIDGSEPFPDPRSFCQAQGVHGPSRWVDHQHFQWTDAQWQQVPLASALIYELHIGTFSAEGTFEAAIEHLDYLCDLGVTHVELMPVAEFSGKHGWGYDGVHLFAPHTPYGGPLGLKRLINACHQKGLAVILDVVYNHLGPSGNYLAQFGPYFTNKYVTPWGAAVNLDGPESEEVRRYFIDNALMWLRDYHIDGLRLDATHAIIDTSALHFLEQLAQEVDVLQTHLGKHLVLIAESDANDARVIRHREQGGYGLHAQWNEDFHHALHALLTREQKGYYQDFGRLAHLKKVLTQGLVYDGSYSSYRKRHHGRPTTGLCGSNFVACLQNHDQIGNRAVGDRTSQLLTPGQIKIGAALVLTSPFIPMLFQGEEWAASTPFMYFTDHREPELADAVRQGRRKEFSAFGWSEDAIPDPQDATTFHKSKLDWHERDEPQHQEILAWHRALICLRKQFPELMPGDFRTVCVEFDQERDWMVIERGSLLVVCNFAKKPQKISAKKIRGKSLCLASENDVVIENQSVQLPGHAVVILCGRGAPTEASGYPAAEC